MQNQQSTVFQHLNSASSQGQVSTQGGGIGMGLVQFPEQEQLRCPRCDSTNTKFCYYNNYNLSQPRHYCKACRRYWTKGGALRNIPVGGGSRKNSTSSSSKRSSSNTSPPTSKRVNSDRNLEASLSTPPTSSELALSSPSDGEAHRDSIKDPGSAIGPDSSETGGSISFNSLLPSTGSSYVGPGQNEHVEYDTGMMQTRVGEMVDLNSGLNSATGQCPNGSEDGAAEEYLNSGGGWPDLSIFSRSSSFQ